MRTIYKLTAMVLGMMLFAWHQATAQKSVTYQINPEHNGATRFPQGFKVPLQRVWSRTFQGVYFRYPTRISYPVIADGRVFVIVTAFSPTGNMKVVAMSLASGEILWSKAIGERVPPAALAFENDRLFVVSHVGIVRALDPSSGAELWTTRLTDQYSFSAPPSARNGRLYIGGSGGGGTLFALNQRSGKVVWKQTVLNGGVSSPTVTNDAVFVAYPGRVYKFAKSTGALLWHKHVGPDGGGGATAPFYSGLLYTRVRSSAEGTPVWVFDADSGQHLSTIENIYRPPAFHGRFGYFAGSDRLTARDITTEQALWEFTGGQAPALPPLVINGKVIVASHGGDLFVLDGASGAQLQRTPLDAEVPVNGENPFDLHQGMGAGEGMLIVPAGDILSAFKGAQ